MSSGSSLVHSGSTAEDVLTDGLEVMVELGAGMGCHIQSCIRAMDTGHFMLLLGHMHWTLVISCCSLHTFVLSLWFDLVGFAPISCAWT
jgi:hypothetical protein